MKPSETAERLERLENTLFGLLQEIQALRAQAQRQTRETDSIEPLLDAPKVAEILGVDIAYVYSLARDGKIPSLQIGKYRRFHPRQLQKWLDRRNSC